MHSKVVHCKKAPYDIYIGRPSKWGNPFKMTGENSRNEVIKQYRTWLMKHPEKIEEAKKELKGKILGCWCAPKLCHGDVLAGIANEEMGDGRELYST